MKLLYLINGLGAGGAERSLAELLPYYRDAGVNTTVACLRPLQIGVEADVRLVGCDIVFLSGSGRAGWIREFRRLISDLRPDLIHTTLFDSHIVGRLGAVGTGVPVLSSLVNTPYDASRARDRDINPLGFRMVKLLDGWTARHLTTHFHAITHAVSDAYVRSVGLDPERITVVERGRDTERLGVPDPERRKRVRASLGLPQDAEILINVGRQEYQKGQPALLQAVALLAERNPRLVLLIAGREGNLTRELRSVHQSLGLGDRVRFLGHRSDVPDLLAASDVFAFPSHFEGLGGAVIEAMALGLPVVASDIPALREVVEDGRSATLVEPGSPTSIAAAVQAFLDDPAKREAFGARGRVRFHERFEIGRSAERMIALYERLVGPKLPVVAPRDLAEATR